MNSRFLIISIFCLFAVRAHAQCPVTITDLQAVSETCIGDCNGSATVVATGSGNLTYQWYDGNGVPISGSISTTVTGVCAGDYTVEVTTDAGGGTITIYEEDFEGSQTWSLLNNTGNNGTTPNFWTISDAEGGVTPPGCGIQTNGDNTLHITSELFPTAGASYDAGGLCGIGYCPETSVRAESPNISTIGSTSLVLNFNFISLGDGLNDNASVWYNDGSGWTELTASIKSVNCQSGQGEWTAYSQALPSSCENISNLKVGINWVNNDDGVGSDPSVAINDLIITGDNGGGGGCTVLSNVIAVGQPQPIVLDSVVIADVSCAGNTDGSIILSVSGGNPSYTFSMDAGVTFPNSNGLFNSLAAGIYGFVVQDDTGCILTTDSVEVIEAVLSPPVVSGVLEYCESGSTTLSASFGFADYAWLPGNLTGASVDVTAGTYVAVATDVNGCVIVSDSVTVTENLNPVPVITGDSIVCTDETTILNAGANYSEYAWLPNGETSQTIEVGTGAYSVSVTDDNGCVGSSAQQTVSELIFTPLSITIIGDSLFVATGVGSVYQWHLNQAPIPGGVNSYFVATENGVYSLYYEDSNGCSHFTDSVSLQNVSVKFFELDKNVSVFPNPVSHQLSVSFGNTTPQENFNINMMDATGRVVQAIQNISQGNQTIDVSMLNDGLYILQVKTETEIVTRRVVVRAIAR